MRNVANHEDPLCNLNHLLKVKGIGISIATNIIEHVQLPEAEAVDSTSSEQRLIKPWTAEEDEIILSQQKIVGNKWAYISRLLDGRTHNDVKNRWHKSLITVNERERNKKIQRRERNSKQNILPNTNFAFQNNGGNRLGSASVEHNCEVIDLSQDTFSSDDESSSNKKQSALVAKETEKNADGKTTQYMFSDSDEEDAMLSLTERLKRKRGHSGITLQTGKIAI